jgi:hypothetical protein
MTIDELRTAALLLPPSDRAKLASELLESLDELDEAEIEQLWIEEALRRDTELDAGTARSVPAADVFASVRSELQ